MPATRSRSRIEWPIAVLSFARPDLLREVLLSLKNQTVRFDATQIYLFQDGNVDPFTGNKLVEDQAVQECVQVFASVFPEGKSIVSDVNLSVALNFDRAERWLFEDRKVEAALFFEDDLVLSRHYLAAMRPLVDFALAEPKVAYVAAYGDHRARLDQQLINRRKVIPMRHKWGFGLTRRQWQKQAPLLEPYLDLVRQRPYTSRDHDTIRAYLSSLGYTCPGTSQDAAKDVASAVLGTAKIMSYACFGKYIGRHGVHQREHHYIQEGYDSTILFPDRVTKFDLPDTDMLDCIARNQCSPAARKGAASVPVARPRLPGGLPQSFGRPHLSADELAMMRRVLTRGYRTYLEFGTGGSTLLALQAGFDKVISVDSDPKWVALAREHPELTEAIAAERAKVMHADIGPVAAWGNPADETSRPKWPAYVERAWNCCARHGYRPDLVFVDGRFRVACCLSAALAAEKADVLIHDIGPERPHYDRVFDYFDTVESEQSLYLLRQKPDVDRLELLAQLLRHQFDFR